MCVGSKASQWRYNGCMTTYRCECATWYNMLCAETVNDNNNYSASQILHYAIGTDTIGTKYYYRKYVSMYILITKIID